MSKSNDFILNGLSCSSCAAKIEAEVKKIEGIKHADLNFARSLISVTGEEETMARLEVELQEIADRIEPGLEVEKNSNKNKKNSQKSFLSQLPRKLIIGTGLFFIAILTAELPVLHGLLPNWFMLTLFLTSYFLIGGKVLKIAFRNILRGQIFDENFLMTIATLGAFAIGEYPEGVAVMLFYMIGELFQNRAVARSRSSISSLMDLRPDYANLKDGEKVSQVEPEMVKPGELIVVKPGEKVPLDGEVVAGEGMFDTSALTGESVPRRLEKGDEILSGMISRDGLLTVRVAKSYQDSTVARILELVENASANKAPTEKFISKFARYYTPVVVFAAVAIASLPPLFIENALFADWFYRALIFLVISCPCALVVSIPLGFFGGIGRASRQGILIKGGNYLEALNQVNKIVFDKTGTLTEGVFAVQEIRPEKDMEQAELIELAALAEAHSNHPIAKSIVEAYGDEIRLARIADYQEIAGRGIKAIIDSKEVLAGNYEFMQEKDISCQKANNNGTVVYLAQDGEYLGLITIADQLKSDSQEAISRLRSLGVKEFIMLTGDREEVAIAVAKEVGIDKYYAGLLPAEKVKKVEELLVSNKEDKVAFVGDGINDAPVLARSDIGIAMGGLGSDAAIEAADVVLMSDEPSKLADALVTARFTRRVVWQNIILALGVKGIVLLLGLFGMASMWSAVFADVGVALLAVLNSMRILRG